MINKNKVIMHVNSDFPWSFCTCEGKIASEIHNFIIHFAMTNKTWHIKNHIFLRELFMSNPDYCKIKYGKE